jgi:hypothetical protein
MLLGCQAGDKEQKVILEEIEKKELELKRNNKK